MAHHPRIDPVTLSALGVIGKRRSSAHRYIDKLLNEWRLPLDTRRELAAHLVPEDAAEKAGR